MRTHSSSPAMLTAASPLCRLCPRLLRISPTAAAAAGTLPRMPLETLRRKASTSASASSTSQSGNTTLSTENLVSLEDLKFDNTFTAELPADLNTTNTPRQVSNAFYSWVDPTAPDGPGPTTIAASPAVARLIGLDPSEASRPEFALCFGGAALLPGSRPYAQCYGGHQFGSFAGQLGDGRAICLGEVLNTSTGLRWELQLKGAGRTPYSRFADGRAVLRSSLREYVASEAMAALGVPTTRALSLVATGDSVVRDMFYNGNAKEEPGAIVCRVARSFVRFGTFQLPASRGEEESKLVGLLTDYVIKYFYPECKDAANPAAALLEAVARRTGTLMSEWQRVGFTHGVGNTDNFSILGDTIDYGPYGWLERFDPDFTPNTTDLPGRRYSFYSQPEIGQWNVLQLARAFIAAGEITEDEARAALTAYGAAFSERYSDAMARKMGLKEFDRVLTNALFKEMFEDGADYTNTFRALSSVDFDRSGDDGAIPADLAAAIGLEALSPERAAAWEGWVRLYRAALRAAGWGSPEERVAVQNAANPAIVPRNHVLVGIIGEAEVGNYGPLEEYMAALERPYASEGLDPAWLEPGPRQARLGVELLSCSS